MKRVLFLMAVAIACALPHTAQAKGGAGPCLATCLMGDTRIGLAMNEGKPIDKYDWINFGCSIISYSSGGISLGSPTVGSALNTASCVGKVYTAYENGYKQAGGKGFCVGWLWGNRPGRMFNEYKLRTKEIMLCIPIVQCYPLIVLPLEAFNGKTLTEVIEEESLKR